MREPIELIEYRLLKLGLPPEFVAQHLQGVARWRTEHPARPPRIDDQNDRARTHWKAARRFTRPHRGYSG